MSPLSHRRAPRTPTKSRGSAPRVSIPTSRSAPTIAAPKVGRSDPRDASPPGRAAGDSVRVSNAVVDAHAEAAAEMERASEQDGGERAIGATAREEPLVGPERQGAARNQDKGSAETVHRLAGRRSATFSQVVSSGRTSLAGLGQRAPTPAVTPVASSPYVPPHIRKAFLRSIGKENNPLAFFDRSACPEPEDSFYSHISSAFASQSPFSTPNTSFAHSDTSASSANKVGARVLRISTPASLPPHHTLLPRLSGPAAPSPTTLISCQPYIDPAQHPHPAPILEDEREEDHPHAAQPPSSTPSWADEVDAEYPLKTYIALTPAEEALLAHDGADETSEAGFGVQIAVQLRRGSVFTAASSPIGVPEDEKEVGEGACTGCGADKTDCFVNLAPCGHSLCPVCINALVNAVAHKPPRPTTCFACAAPVSSFVPTTPATKSGKNLVAALLDSVANGQVERRQSVCGPKDVLAGEGIESVEARRRRRRSSVIAAALATDFSTPTKSRGKPYTTPTSPTEALSHDDHDDDDGKSAESPLARRSLPGTGPLTSSPTLLARLTEPRQGTASLPRGETSISSAPPDSPFPHGALAHSRRTTEHDPFSSAPEPRRDSRALIPPVVERANVDWPVVRLDNVPWEVTLDEIEAWLPRGSLASAGAGSGGEGRAADEGRLAAGEGVTLAVHILCNRADGRTLNQAYIECSSRAAARKVVRFRDGVILRNRTIHVTISSQAELLSTVFPTYRPGFDGLKPLSSTRGGPSAPIPLLVQTELSGLLNLCRLELMHARKAPERPFFNIVTLLEKMPWAYPQSYNSAAVVRLYNTACAAIEILGTVKRVVAEWQDILAVLVDAILRCPVFRPQQKQRAVHLAASLGYERFEPITNTRVPLPSVPAPRTVAGIFDGFTFPFKPASLEQSYVSTASDSATTATAPLAGSSAAGHASERPASLDSSASSVGGSGAAEARQHRRSSLVAELGVEPALLDAVAKALGVRLVGSSPAPDADADADDEGSEARS